ncbi:MAG: GDSL-type esterase/lipase family protein [Solirubrobacteraceae bacterium]
MTSDRRVLFFGDSFVAGVGDRECRGWVGRVTAASAAADMSFTAYPLGVRRDTSAQVAARWRAEALPRLADDADCRVVFSFGANDATVECGQRRVEPDLSAKTLARVLDEAAQLDLRAFVVGPPPVADVEQDDCIARLSQRFGTICAQREVPFVAVFDALGASPIWAQEAQEGDGVHPGAGGYEALACLVLAGGWLDWLR